MKEICNLNWDSIQKDRDQGMKLREILKKYKLSWTKLDMAMKSGIFIRGKTIKDPMTPETKKNLSEKRTKFLKENPDKHPWRKKGCFKSIPCEFLKKKLRDIGLIFLEELMPLDDRSFSLDIAFPEKKIGIEVNGNQHYEKNGELKPYYQNRHNLIEASGWKLIEIPCGCIWDKELVNKIKEVLEENNSIGIEDCVKRYRQKGTGRQKESCIICGKMIQKKNSRCKDCYHKLQKETSVFKRKVERPIKEVLEKEIGIISWIDLGKKYGVSDVAVRKWAKQYGLKWDINKKNYEPICCEKCGDKIKDRKISLCRSCYLMELRKDWPTKEQLIEDMRTMKYKEIGNKYSVFRTTIKYWAKQYGLI